MWKPSFTERENASNIENIHPEFVKKQCFFLIQSFSALIFLRFALWIRKPYRVQLPVSNPSNEERFAPWLGTSSPTVELYDLSEKSGLEKIPGRQSLERIYGSFFVCFVLFQCMVSMYGFNRFAKVSWWFLVVLGLFFCLVSNGIFARFVIFSFLFSYVWFIRHSGFSLAKPWAKDCRRANRFRWHLPCQLPFMGPARQIRKRLGSSESSTTTRALWTWEECHTGLEFRHLSKKTSRTFGWSHRKKCRACRWDDLGWKKCWPPLGCIQLLFCEIQVLLAQS